MNARQKHQPLTLFILQSTWKSPSIHSPFSLSSFFAFLHFFFFVIYPLILFPIQCLRESLTLTHSALTSKYKCVLNLKSWGSTLLRLRAALSLPPGVRFLSWTSSSSTSWAMARTVDVTSPGRRSPLVCSASSLATIAAVSPERSWEPNAATGEQSQVRGRLMEAKKSAKEEERKLAEAWRGRWKRGMERVQ